MSRRRRAFQRAHCGLCALEETHGLERSALQHIDIRAAFRGNGQQGFRQHLSRIFDLERIAPESRSDLGPGLVECLPHNLQCFRTEGGPID